MPHAIRAEGGRRGGRSRIYRHRRRKFEQAFADLTREGQTITKEDILTVFADVFQDGYALGYRACEAKWHQRRPRAA